MSRRSRRSFRVEDAAVLFAALGDGTRLRLVGRLAEEGPASATELSEEAEVTRQAISKHLEVLARAGLVRDRREGRERIWELEPAGLDAARTWLDRIAAQWDDALEGLKRFVEEERCVAPDWARSLARRGAAGPVAPPSARAPRTAGGAPPAPHRERARGRAR